ncbi:ATP phosphoribosyltransferase catalytic subunit [Gracilibacillus halophilus YIM-C55.5]|uniref:ATP phosphoribosyltransferase n=1 Tax=Gracilibacillus halophilus YIM-C55.5 TaxID=1308866 RepID=N4WCM6_9BACI|nr:ATP phosphoribosyltransferase [Gracilibacillus halophilus]ENH96984.1 ATP phosphoribosyltransferase catalytic subunit [Gracilibacillus halophilus YIM-C55.5]
MKPVIALTKGRLEKQFLNFFETLDYETEPLVNKGRKLQVETEQFSFFFAKGPDVTTYVENGIADLGVVGGDILLEHEPDVFNLFPLPFGKCRMALATKAGYEWPDHKKRIASTFTNITNEYYREKGESVDIIKLEGSVELAPILGLADGIVDIVETGTTLKENGLVVQDEFLSFSARLIANRSNLKIKRNQLVPVIESFKKGANQA